MSENEKLLYEPFLQKILNDDVNTNLTNSNPSSSANSFAQTFEDQSNSKRLKTDLETAQKVHNFALGQAMRIEAKVVRIEAEVERIQNELQQVNRLLDLSLIHI